MRRSLPFAGLMLALWCIAAVSPRTPFEFRDGDRVALVGDTLIEREPEYGYIEERLTIEFPDRNVIFRNLGWSADTPAGESRASFDFDKPGKGFEKLKAQIAAVQPTVVILGYGMADSFAGKSGLAEFRSRINKLMDAILALNTNGTITRFIVLSPIWHENLGAPLPSGAVHNGSLALYAKALEQIASERKCEYVSLFDMSAPPRKGANTPLTEDGIHLSDLGYRCAAERVAQCLGWKSTPDLWADAGQVEALRQAIIEKNRLYFDRWRPQNETYLFGFRKHEQGQNAVEIPKFDPLIEEKEKLIAELRRPKSHTSGGVKSGVFPHEFHSVIKLEKTGDPQARSAPGEGRLPASAATNSIPEFDVESGFDVNLYAESPLLAKPIQMNFDPQGRLWIASSSVYPQIQPGQVADDKILVLEDTDGDGYAEKSTVFADGLLIPTGVIPGDGGAYVGQATELLHLKDTNGDGHADRKRIVLSSFGTEDTHHMVHTLRWGPDGKLYFNQSIYIHTHIETPHGVERLNSGGVWHLRPDTLELGVFLRGFCNPWGHQFDDFGQSFETDGAGYQGISYGLPGATYFTYANMRREMASISPGNYPKFCGLEIVRSSHFPPEWQGHAITCDFRAHRIVRFEIKEDGAGYSAREVSDLLRSTNVTFRPIDVKLGPDGALYVADWSNPIIQHGEVDFRDPRRDHEHGRIWRITAKGRRLVRRPQLAGAPNLELFDQLVSPEAFNQEQARRVLTERGRAIHRDLDRWTAKQTSEKALLQSLWMHEAINQVEPVLLHRALAAKDGRIRAAAVRVAGDWTPRLGDPIQLLGPRMKDAHPRVRLETMRALAALASPRSAELVLSEVDNPMDRFLDYAAWLSINDLAKPWIASVKAGQWKSEGRERQLEFALKAIEPSLAAEVLTMVLSTREIPRDGKGPWIELIGSAGDTKLLRRLLDQALKNDFDEPAKVRALKALNVAAKERNARPEEQLSDIRRLLEDTVAEPVRTEAIALAGRWKLNTLLSDVAAIAGNSTTGTNMRQAAFDSLREVGGREAVTTLETLSGSTNAAAVRRPAVLALAGTDFHSAQALAVGLLLETTNETESAELWRSLLSIKGAATNLARALPRTGLPAGMAKAGLRVAREGGRNEPDLVWALTRGGNLEEETQALSAAELQELAKTALRDGNAARGETIFRRKDLTCTACHAIGGVGGKVGPDLTSIGASAQPDYLIESVLYPNRKIKEGYHSVSVETKGGMEYTGVVASENNETLVLRDATGKEISVPKKDIENRVTGGSLMPSGLVDVLSPAERVDLYKFLSELGKPGPFDASRSTVARAWKLFPQTLDAAQFGDQKILETKLEDDQWKPAVSLVDGRLLKHELEAPLNEVKSRDPRAIFAAARCEVAKSGAVAFKLTGAEASSVWIDGQPMKSGSGLTPELQPGKHTVFIRLDANKLPDALRLESPDATFLTN